MCEQGSATRWGQRQPTRYKILSAGGTNVVPEAPQRSTSFLREKVSGKEKKIFKSNFRIFIIARVIHYTEFLLLLIA